LQEKIHLLQKLAFATDKDKQDVLTQIVGDFIDHVLDTGYLVEIVNGVIDQLELGKVTFYFDEAAHTFIPTQQEIFFEIFKLLHGARIAAKAAVYPSVTSHSRNFEIGHYNAFRAETKRQTPSSKASSRRGFCLRRTVRAKGECHSGLVLIFETNG